MNARRGFTLLEVMVASAMALAIVAAASSSVMVIVRTLNRTGQSNAAVSELQLLSEYLLTQLQGIGGGPVRPWMVTVVRNNTGDNGSDVLRFADVPSTLPTSATLMRHMSAGTFSLFQPSPTPRDPGRGQCGLSDLRKDTDGDGFPQGLADTAAAYRASEFVGLQAILASPSGTTWRSVVVADAGIAATPGGCFIRFDGGASGLTANGEFVAADRIDRDAGSEDLEQWVGGQVAFVRAREWRFVPAAAGVPGRLVETLIEGRDRTERTLFEGALDLQIAVGYDHAPFDGVLDETPDGVDDEWLNQRPTESPAFARLPEDLEAADIGTELIRMLDVAVVIALPRAERTSTVRAFDGPSRSGPEARIAGGRAYLRNLLLFL
jgi:prepilin-type N-terminal cleavage/methylation domain-containing protein